MRFSILDVGHGFCAYAEARDGALVLFDCGHKAEPEFRPSSHLYGRGHRSTARLFITNYDEDHISDLLNVQTYLPASILHRNSSISADVLAQVKRQAGPITPAMTGLLDMIRRYTSDVTNPPALLGVGWESYSHRYGARFTDTNNLSLVTFLRVGSLSVVIPGDLECPGWREHLTNSAFRKTLAGVNVFVASHHGRESGYCEEVFAHCRPDVVIISDGPRQFASQEMVTAYARHAVGVTFQNERRSVLTTRNDGTIWWEL